MTAIAIGETINRGSTTSISKNLMAPLVANYYLTYRCNARCHFCNIWQQPAPSEADLATIRDNLRDLRRLGVKYVDFTGGEPLLRRDVADIYAQAKQLGFATSLTTNTMLYPQKAREMQGLVDFLNFSLDGADATTHNQSRGVPLFNKVIESVKIARDLGEYPVLNHTVTAQNYQNLADVATLARELGVRVWLNPAFTAHESYDASKNPTGDIVDAIANIARKFPNVGYNRAALAFIQAGGNDTENPRCKAIDAAIAVSPDNQLLLPCYHFAQDSLPIEGNLYDLYRQSATVEKHRQLQGKLPVCEGCTIWCSLVPSFFKGFDKYWFLNASSYIREFLARKITS